MAHDMNGHHALQLLTAMGFVVDPEDGTCSITYSGTESLEGVPSAVTLKVSGANGGSLWEGSYQYCAIASYDTEGVLDVEFEASDIRDIMALALGLKNTLLADIGDHSSIPAADVYVVDGTAIHNAFYEEDFQDWNVDSETPTSIHLGPPGLGRSIPYLAWRDSRAIEFIAALHTSGLSNKM